MSWSHPSEASTARACVALASVVIAFSASADMARTPAPADAKVYFIEPVDGAVIKGPVRVIMGLTGAGVAPAGVDAPNTGHHHILVNVDVPPLDAPLPANDNFRHFGGGQTEAVLDLPAGTHTLQLLVGDQNHVPHLPPIISDKITITVSD